MCSPVWVLQQSRAGGARVVDQVMQFYTGVRHLRCDSLWRSGVTQICSDKGNACGWMFGLYLLLYLAEFIVPPRDQNKV